MSAASHMPPEPTERTPPASLDDASPGGLARPEEFIESPVFFSEVLKAFERAVRGMAAAGDGGRAGAVPPVGGG